jgi:catecholate siderophore receptor
MRGLLFTTLMAGAFLSRAYSQAPLSSLHGKILDPSNAAIVGAEITATPETNGNADVLVFSDQTGQFALALEPGKYVLKISAKGFLETCEVVDIGDAPQSLYFVLQLPGLNQSVDVTSTAGYQVSAISSATRMMLPLRDVPQSITVVTEELIKDQGMTSMADVMRYVPGIDVHQGENNRDQIIIRGNSTSADFFLNGVRDDVQYYRDLYNLDRLEALKGPNAMIFGRGGGGGVVNRVTKEAGFQPLHAFTMQGGRFGNKRVTGDVDQPLNARVAFRINGMYENSDSFRRHVGLDRTGVNPTMTFLRGDRTRITTAYEYLRDRRVADRGITSLAGRPAPVDPSTYYGNPDDSHVRADVHLASASVEHRLSRMTIRNRAMFGDYDRGYQNYVPGAAAADRSTVALTAYNNATRRKNLFNQTDFLLPVSTGRVRHTLLFGTEFGLQLTDNLRNTGFFNNTATAVNVPYNDPVVALPVVYRQSASDADNHLRANIAAAFAQDHVELTKKVQVIGGIRFDRFDMQYHNNRNNDNLTRIDQFVSPRAGLVIKPVTEISLYTSYSVSYLPSSGDQFSSLTTITQQVKPEKFNNYEVGVKWDAMPDLSFTASGYRLDRTNTRSTDPNDPTRIVQTGSQRTNGFELGLIGTVRPKWQISGGYAYQNGFVRSATAVARAGSQVGQVPHHTFSLWNNYKVHPRVAAALGLVTRSDMFVAVDNSVVLPGYFRADAAVYISLSENVRIQGNLENILNTRYFGNADSNTNISPGSPRAFRIGLTTRF